MPAKSKLTIALLAATAMFTLNPALIPSIVFNNLPVSAEEITTDGLGELIGEDASTPGKLNGKLDAVNQALAPVSATSLEDSADPSIRAGFKPGENPFMKADVPAVRTNVVPVTATAADPKVIAQPDPGAVVNPFATADSKAADLKKVMAERKPTRKIDENALRYYASAKDLKRLGAEMRRLKSLYPEWQPPKDLFSPPMQVSEQPLWDIYKTNDYAAVRARIAMMQSASPNWRPTDDLLKKLEMGEGRALINRAFAQRRWAQVISAAQATPSVMVCDEMQVLWNVGESFARLKNYAEAFELYKYVLANCDDAHLRMATVQKASLIMPSQGISSLIALGRILPDGTGEFDNVGFDGLRRQIGEFIQHGDFSSLPSEDDLKRFVDFVERTGSANDAGLIAWYFYAQEEWETSNGWFIRASQFERSPKNIEGVILTLRNMEKADDALKVARRYMKASPEIARQYIEIVASDLTAEEPSFKLKDKDVETFQKVVIDQQSALGAQALGWKLIEDDTKKAQEWFSQSVKWEPTEGGVIGLAVLASRAKNYSALNSLKSKYLEKFAALDDFKVYRPKIYKPRKIRAKVVREEKPKRRTTLM